MDMISVHIVLMIIELNMYSYVRAAALESAQSFYHIKEAGCETQHASWLVVRVIR